jgi:hypothetical protein
VWSPNLGMDEAVLDQLGSQVDRTVPAPGYQARQLPVHVVLIRYIHLKGTVSRDGCDF